MLQRIHRTHDDGLLLAAAALRDGGPPQHRGNFRLLTAVGVPMAAANLANAIAWRRGGDVAVITPSLAGNFARDVLSRVGLQACGQQGNGPYTVHWEAPPDAGVATVVGRLQLEDPAPVAEVILALSAIEQVPQVRLTIDWFRRQQRAGGIATVTIGGLTEVIARQATVHRQHVGSRAMELSAMTVQQAKNREFDGTVVLWPFRVGGDAVHKRRLLYNAITRARRWCTVIVQGAALRNSPPFA